jgi:hypothetical protein
MQAAIRSDQTINNKERKRRLKALPSLLPETVTQYSAWWSWDTVRMDQVVGIEVADLAFVKLQGFDAAMIASYPVFKDPAKPMQQGRSLCRLGFPFHTVTPSYDATTNIFHLPPGSVPPPFFPNDGIFTRIVEIPPPNPAPPFKLSLIETSSPGLLGQSGGPIFDQDGNIWGIQSRTAHYPLGFSPEVPGGKKNEKEHQFMNVGWGIHAETIVGAMRDRGIAFDLSTT